MSQRHIELADQVLGLVNDQDNYSDVFNAMGIVIVGFCTDYIQIEGEPVNRETLTREFTKFLSLLTSQADFMLSRPQIYTGEN